MQGFYGELCALAYDYVEKQNRRTIEALDIFFETQLKNLPSQIESLKERFCTSAIEPLTTSLHKTLTFEVDSLYVDKPYHLYYYYDGNPEHRHDAIFSRYRFEERRPFLEDVLLDSPGFQKIFAILKKEFEGATLRAKLLYHLEVSISYTIPMDETRLMCVHK